MPYLTGFDLSGFTFNVGVVADGGVGAEVHGFQLVALHSPAPPKQTVSVFLLHSNGQ